MAVRMPGNAASRSMRAMAALVIGLLATACGGTETPAPESGGDAAVTATVFDGARLIIGDGSPAMENATFVVDSGRFTQVGAAADVTVPEGAAHVDLSGKTVMPAIVDTHTHIRGTREEIIEQLRRKAYFGVSVVTSLGQDEGDLPFELRAEVIPDAALFKTAGRGLTRPEPGRSEVPYWVDTPEQTREAVRELAERQVDLVKLWVDDRDGQYEKLTPELYGAAIDEAHMHGLRVTAHIFTLEDAKGLLRAGIDAFAHGVRDRDIDDEFLMLVAERPEVTLVPNLPDPGVVTNYEWLRGSIPDAQVDELIAGSTDRPAAQEAFGIQSRNLDRLNQAGMRIAFGTDGNISWAHHLEMADMVTSGMTPAEVIVAATRTSAELLRMPDHGPVATGNSADFLVLDANPLDDITNTRRIDAVYLRGSAVDRDAIRADWMNDTAP